MIKFLQNVKNIIQHYCIQEMGWGGVGEEGETHWSNTLPLKHPAFHPAMDDSMT